MKIHGEETRSPRARTWSRTQTGELMHTEVVRQEGLTLILCCQMSTKDYPQGYFWPISVVSLLRESRILMNLTPVATITSTAHNKDTYPHHIYHKIMP